MNISPKSPRIELSNNTFAKRKCCQVVAYESETFHRLRPNGISHCENGEQKPRKPPLPLTQCGPHLIQQCLGPPHAPPQTAAPTVEALSHTDAVKSPLVTIACPKFAPQKYSFQWTDPQTPAPASSLDPSNLWCQTASGSDPPFFHNALDRPTHGQTNQPTDRLSTGKFDDYTIAHYASNKSDTA